MALEDSHNIIEVALEAPKKKSGYFAAPAQQDPEDQLIIPPSLEQDVREQLRGQSPVVPGPPPAPSTPPSAREPNLDHPQPTIPGLHPTTVLQQDVYDTAL